MDFFEVVRKRRSIRRFKPDPVPDEYVEKIIEAARWAQSGANGQPCEFIVVKDPATRKKIVDNYQGYRWRAYNIEKTRIMEARHLGFLEPPTKPASFQDAPVFIVICGDPRTAQATVLNRLCDRRWVVDENIANATQIIHLAAAACGLGSQWVTVDRYYEDLIRPILRVPPIIRIFSMAPIGYPAMKPKNPYRRELKEMVHYDTYDMTKYRSHEDVQDFIRNLRGESKRAYPLHADFTSLHLTVL